MALFITDEHIALELVEALAERGHDVLRAIDVLGEKTPDSAIIAWAHEWGAIVVTANVKHFAGTINRRVWTHHRASGLFFDDVKERRMRERLGRFWDHIDAELAAVARHPKDKRMIVVISTQGIQIKA